VIVSEELSSPGLRPD